MLLLWPALWQLQCPENHWHCTLKLWMKGLLCFSASSFMFMAKHKGRLRTKPVRFSCTLPLLCYVKKPQTHRKQTKTNQPTPNQHTLLWNTCVTHRRWEAEPSQLQHRHTAWWWPPASSAHNSPHGVSALQMNLFSQLSISL